MSDVTVAGCACDTCRERRMRIPNPPTPTFVIDGYRMQTATQPPKGLYE